MSEVKQVSVTSIDANPHRDLDTYPWIESKVEALCRSIDAVGLWEGIIVRPAGKRYQLAFGHHRLEAAKRNGIAKVKVIVRDLYDQQMLEFMGRENGEDYSTDFLVMLNTWEGAVNFEHQRSKPIETARLLGWTTIYSDGGERMTPVAKHCASAYELIAGGHMVRPDFDGLSVKQAGEIVMRAKTRINKIAERGEALGHKPSQVKAAQESVAKGAKAVAQKAKAGKLSTTELGASVDLEAYKSAGSSKPKKQLLFSAFGDALATQLSKTINTDAASEKLKAVIKSLELIEQDDDKRVVDRLHFELRELAARADEWAGDLVVPKTVQKRIVELKAIEGGKA
jgi:hypothetical protein